MSRRLRRLEDPLLPEAAALSMALIINSGGTGDPNPASPPGCPCTNGEDRTLGKLSVSGKAMKNVVHGISRSPT